MANSELPPASDHQTTLGLPLLPPSPFFNSAYDAKSATSIPQAQPDDVNVALNSLSADQAATLLVCLPESDKEAFLSALPAPDRQQLGAATGWLNVTAQELSSLPPGDFTGAFQQLPTDDLRIGLQTMSESLAAQSKKDVTANADEPVSNSGTYTPTPTYANSNVLLAEGALLTSFGASLSYRDAKLRAAEQAASRETVAARTTKVETFDTPKVMSEGPFQGGTLTKLTTTPEGVLTAENGAGIFGPGTFTEMKIFASPTAMREGPFVGGKYTRLSTKTDEAVGENPDGIFNHLQGSTGTTTITKYTVRPNGAVSENPAGLEGPGSRTLAAQFREPVAVQSGPFEGMKLTHLSALPTEDGQVVTAINRDGLFGEGSEISKVATLSVDELKWLLKGTTVKTIESGAATAAEDSVEIVS